MTGQTRRARRMLAAYEEAGDHCATGLLHAALGDADAAPASLSRIRAWSYRATLSIHHYYPGLLDALRRDARYRLIAERANRAWGLGTREAAVARPSAEPT